MKCPDCDKPLRTQLTDLLDAIGEREFTLAEWQTIGDLVRAMFNSDDPDDQLAAVELAYGPPQGRQIESLDLP